MNLHDKLQLVYLFHRGLLITKSTSSWVNYSPIIRTRSAQKARGTRSDYRAVIHSRTRWLYIITRSIGSLKNDLFSGFFGFFRYLAFGSMHLYASGPTHLCVAADKMCKYIVFCRPLAIALLSSHFLPTEKNRKKPKKTEKVIFKRPN